MDNGYREIVIGDICQAGDQYKFRGRDWLSINPCSHGRAYILQDFENSTYRRPIAKDEKAYATDTKAIVAHALDATANAPDEWPYVDIPQSQWLPEVGEECELSIEGDYSTGSVIFYGENIVVLRGASGAEASFAKAWCTFRPIKTPELLAAEKNAEVEAKNRNEFLYAAEDVFFNVKSISMRQSNENEIAEAFYDWLNSDESPYQLTKKDKVDE